MTANQPNDSTQLQHNGFPPISRLTARIHLSHFLNMRQQPGPPRLFAEAPAPPLHLHSTHHALGRVDIHAAHDIAGADVQVYKGYAEPPIMAAQHGESEERGGG